MTEPASLPPQHRPWFRFRLRSLLIATAIVAIPLAWVAKERRQSQYEMWIAWELWQQGVQDVAFAGPYDSAQLRAQGKPQGRWRDFARRLLGERIIGIHHVESGLSSTGPGQGLPHKYLMADWVGDEPELSPDCNLELLADLTCLQTLSLFNVPVRNLAPLADLRTLESLSLTPTHGVDFRPLARLTQLKTIRLDCARVTDLAPLAHLTNLEELSLTSTPVVDLSPLVGLSQLRTLHLDRTPVKDLAPLAGLTNLRELTLSSTPVSDLTPLSKLTNLNILHLEETEFEDLKPLAVLKNLQELYLGEMPGLGHRLSSDDGLQAKPPSKDISPLAALTKLNTLWLNHLPVAKEQVEALQTALPKCDIVHNPIP